VELLELEMFECEKIGVLQLHVPQQTDTGERERRVGDPVAAVVRITREKKIYNVWQKVGNGRDGFPGFVGRVVFLSPQKPFKNVGE